MDEYVSRKKLEEAFDNADTDVCESDMDGHSDWGFGRENVRDVIRGVPAADVALVVHGRWIEDHDYLKCPKCGVMVEWDFTFFDIGNWNYCPNCGAKMDKEDEDDDGIH